MSSATDNAAFPPSPPAPSVFISYASEDRAAALKLRETLSAAGIDVWYDEQELHGGDAWDQKIRRQIRDCDYFMPVISATTEARKEGYFRREWRLATDRSLDMADDVLFLVPVVIDGTSETGARVPDKFFSVQWLRAPGGQATPALHHLIRRILAGDHHALTRAPMAMTRPPMAAPTAAPFLAPPSPEPPVVNPPPVPPHQAADPHAGAIPPMPPFPHVPEKGGFFHGIKFIAEVLWWALSAAWLLFKRLPRWAQILVTIWLVLFLFSSRGCSKPSVSVRDPEAPHKKVVVPFDDIAKAVRDARKQGNPGELAKLGAEITRQFNEASPDLAAAGRRLILLPFAPLDAEDPEDKFANAVFALLYGQLSLTHGHDVGLFRQLGAGASDEEVLARAKRLGATFVLVGRLAGEGDARALTVRLLNVKDGSVQWSDSFAAGKSEATAAADTINENIEPLLPEHPPARPKKSE